MPVLFFNFIYLFIFQYFHLCTGSCSICYFSTNPTLSLFQSSNNNGPLPCGMLQRLRAADQSKSGGPKDYNYGYLPYQVNFKLTHAGVSADEYQKWGIEIEQG